MGIDTSKLEHGKFYMVTIPGGSSPRMCKWTSRLNQFYGMCTDRDIEPDEAREVRGPIDFDSLPIITQGDQR